jgi:hypothetical protein
MKTTHTNEGTNVQLRIVSDDELEYRIDAWTNQGADLKEMSRDPKFSAKIRAAASQLRPFARAKLRQAQNEKEYRVLKTRIARASALEVSWGRILQPFVNVHNMRLQKVQADREANNIEIKGFLDGKAGHFEKMILTLIFGMFPTVL